MTRRMACFLTSLYPRRWRERYREEFVEFLQGHPSGIFATLNVITGALYQHWRALREHHVPGTRRATVFSTYEGRARRAIFFARYEASHVGSRIIEADHLLLGVLREHGDAGGRFLNASTATAISESARSQLISGERRDISGDLPLSEQCKRILAYSYEEAERLRHRVGIEHLLLGILREDKSHAASILRNSGLDLDAMRAKLAREA
jgi:ATP-dependent Clp protease ATP-binding subunit ClpC